MKIYTFQPQELVDSINRDGAAMVQFEKTNLYRNTQESEKGEQYNRAYLWMGRKLGEKTGIWMKDIYGPDLDVPKDADGDYVDDEGQKMPVFPFWGWYLTAGENNPPDESYRFDVGDIAWNREHEEMCLVTLKVPDRLVLLSDANAWYTVLEGRPCYEYESEEDEERLTAAYEKKYENFLTMREGKAQQKIAEELWDEIIGTWDNIFRLEGRRLRSVMGVMETHDVQAVFPVIMKDWITVVEKL